MPKGGGKVGRQEGYKMTNIEVLCPVGHGKMKAKRCKKNITFKDVNIDYIEENFICPSCNLEIADKKQIANTQKAISNAYRLEVGLLSGDQIKQLRKKYKLTQKSLANKMTVGIASIKRWEGGVIQSKSMDKALRNVFWNHDREFNFTGNRELFIPRINLVLIKFEERLGIKLLLKRDKLLYAAKYLWYADMIAHRDIGKSMTGATYAALPYGPQLNNYRDLIDIIKQSDISEAEPLSVEENKIIKVISSIFPEKQLVYNAAHRERIWKSKSMGQIIPYSESSELTEL